MTLAEDLVTAAAQAIRLNHGGLRGTEEFRTDARAAVAAVLAQLRSEGYSYLVSARTDGPRRRHLWRLARDIGDPGVPQAEKPQP